MRKFNLFKVLTIGLLAFPFLSQAQINQGGIPLSYSEESQINTPVHSYLLPDWNAYLEEEKTDEFSKPYMIGLFATTDVQFPESGEFYRNSKNQLMWRTAVKITGAPSIGLYMDEFHLPKGVKMYVHNENKRHILGAYTEENNSLEDGLFAIEGIQGDVAYIELNIEEESVTDQIRLSINQSLVYFRSYEPTLRYINEDDFVFIDNPDQYGLEGESSTCMINANCPPGDNYRDQQRAAVQLIFITNQGAGVCSGTIINSVGNDAETCRPILLTASHCEFNGTGVSNAAYSQLITRFKFQNPDCAGNTTAKQRSMTGANFLTRSEYNPNWNANQINHDFLLLELRNKIPETHTPYLAGVNLTTTMPSTSGSGKHFIGFHHPSGDVKKLLYTKNLSTWGSGGNNWIVQTNSDKTEGMAAQGSSGSGLFDANGNIIGIASTAGGQIQGCGTNGKGQGGAQSMNFINYYKVTEANNYSHSNSNYNSIKSHINPNNANVTSIPGLDCYASGGVNITDDLDQLNNKFENSITIYPNPVQNGEYLSIKTNFKEEQNLNIRLIDIQGRTVQDATINHVTDHTLKMNIANLPNGMYMLHIDNGIQKTTHKVMVR